MQQTSAKKTYYVLDIDYTITRAEEFRDRRNNKDFVTLLEKEAGCHC
jgi:hypothetical protein